VYIWVYSIFKFKYKVNIKFQHSVLTSYSNDFLQSTSMHGTIDYPRLCYVILKLHVLEFFWLLHPISKRFWIQRSTQPGIYNCFSYVQLRLSLWHCQKNSALWNKYVVGETCVTISWQNVIFIMHRSAAKTASGFVTAINVAIISEVAAAFSRR